MNQPTVCCIVVTYNGMKWIGNCLNSLLNSSYNNQIIVIDNASKDETCSFIKLNYPNVQLIESEENLGFGQGNNIGLKLAIENNMDYVFLLNQDAYVEKDTITRLIEVQQKNKEYGIISPVHLNGQGNDFDEDFYFFLIRSNLKALIASAIFNKKKEVQIIDTSFVNAAAWLISGECLKTVGGFDPIFFHYGEDDNYAQRVLYKGYKIGILSTTKIFHDKKRNEFRSNGDEYFNLKNDRIIFLNQACDLRQGSYKKLIVKRLFRYSFLTLLNIGLLNKKEIAYNFGMAKHIAFSYNKINRSRHLSQNEKVSYLD